MSTITPMLDTLLHQVFGRRADIERFTATQPNAPLNAIARIVAARDGTAQADTAERVQSARDAQPGVSRPAGGRARATDAATPQRGAAGQEASSKTATPPDSAELHFSREARSIAALLSRFAQAPAATTRAQAPLFSGQRPPLAPVLASLLGRQLVDSGVFYESHLSKWIEGRHTLAELAREPQAQLPRAAPAQGSARPAQASAGAPTAAASGDAPAPATEPARPPATVSNQPAADGGPPLPTSRHALATASVDAGGRGDDLIHEHLLPVVRQQLDVLSSAIFRWQGMAWPDVPMQWEVREHARERENPEPLAGDAAAERYSTRLSLELPTLGPLQVRMSLSGDGLQMYAWAGRDAGVRALAPQTGLLEQRLRTAGFASASVRLITGQPA